MNSEFIFAKTASGEEAMYKRTRVVKRNVRTVLILVDGKSTVGDLCAKTGNQLLTENALIELEKGGYIARLTEPGSLPAKALGIGTAVMNVDDSRPPSSEIDSMRSAGIESPRSLNVPDEPGRAIVAERAGEDWSKKSDGASDDADPTSPDRRSGADLLKGPMIDPFEADESNPRVPQMSRRRMSMVMLALAGIIVATLLGLVFYPYDRYLPELESTFSQVIGRTVKVQTLKFVLFPEPRLVLGDVRIGEGDKVVGVAEIRIWPSIDSILAQKKILRQVSLNGLSLPVELIAGLPEIFAAAERSDTEVMVDHINVENATVSFGGLSLSEMEGVVNQSAGRLFESMLLRSPDGGTSLSAKREGETIKLNVEGYGWRPSRNSLFAVDSASLEGTAENGKITISKMELRLLDGLVKGSAVLKLEKRAVISGEIAYERVNALRMSEVLGIGQLVTGEMAGKMRFSGAHDSLKEILSKVDAEGEFTFRRGSVRGIDLVEAVRRSTAIPVQGGATSFESLSGKVRLTSAGWQLQGLVMNSGLMQSTGSVEIDKNSAISGKMDLQMRGTANRMRIPVSIGGTLRNPSVQAGRTR